jgi:hypothetical protein
MLDLQPDQLEIVRTSPSEKLFLYGPASCGKTTTGIERLHFLLGNSISGNSILILAPQRTLQEGYQELLRNPQHPPGGEVTLGTVGGLARRMCDLFWPLASEKAGFGHPDQPPFFLTLETAQYFMARLVDPLINEKGFFETITIDRNRLYSQIIDNLNKSAAVGFSHTEIGTRLDSAWIGEPAQRRVYQDVQECVNRFRSYCLVHNLLDFSLQLDVFWNHLWQDSTVRDYLIRTYRHIIYDNIEEDIPRAHDLIGSWLPSFDSALLIYDQEAGFRRFLGADVESGWNLHKYCDREVTLNRSFVNSPPIIQLGYWLTQAIDPESSSSFKIATEATTIDPRNAFEILHVHFYPQLLDEVVKKVKDLVDSGLASGEIVILAPYLSDALRFSLTNRLQDQGLAWQTHRPSRSLRDEPASHALLTLAALSHPQWNIHPAPFDVAYALIHSIEGLDLVRAQLLTGIIYRLKDFSLAPFEAIRSEVQERITFVFGNRYTLLRDWIIAYRLHPPLPLDHFLRKIFGEVLSQPGFGFHTRLDSVRVAASLVESVRKFRLIVHDTDSLDLGQEYLEMLGKGVIASQYLESWRQPEKNAVLVAPAHTFLMMNRPVSVQIWLDPGSSGWYERLSQPLTHPYVLSRKWEQEEAGQMWLDSDEVEAGRHALATLVSGLLRRCRSQLILAIPDLGESGFEQRGVLLKAFQQVLQQKGRQDERD